MLNLSSLMFTPSGPTHVINTELLTSSPGIKFTAQTIACCLPTLSAAGSKEMVGIKSVTVLSKMLVYKCGHMYQGICICNSMGCRSIWN